MSKSNNSFIVSIDFEDIPKRRNQFAIDAMSRRAGKMKDRREPRRGAKNWRHQFISDED